MFRKATKADDAANRRYRRGVRRGGGDGITAGSPSSGSGAPSRTVLADCGTILPPDTLPPPSVLTTVFLRSSNLVLHSETGVPLEPDGLFDP